MSALTKMLGSILPPTTTTPKDTTSKPTQTTAETSRLQEIEAQSNQTPEIRANANFIKQLIQQTQEYSDEKNKELTPSKATQ